MRRLIGILFLMIWMETSLYAQTWPNEPPGSQLLTDWGFTTSLATGWGINGSMNIISDGAAPFSPPNVHQWTYPIGFTGGASPGTLYYIVPGQVFEFYTGFWWKASNPWQGHNSNVNKINFHIGGGAFQWEMIMEMYGLPAGPWHFNTVLASAVDNSHLVPSFGTAAQRIMTCAFTNPSITLGTWYRIEQYTKVSTTDTSRDGILRWWIDGVLCGDFTTVNFVRARMSEYQFSSTWGGTGDVKTETDYFQFDHVHLSVPPSVPPSVPTGLRIMSYAQWLEIALPVIGLSWHFRRALVSVALTTIMWSTVTGLLVKETVAQRLHLSATKLATVYLDWTKKDT